MVVVGAASSAGLGRSKDSMAWRVLCTCEVLALAASAVLAKRGCVWFGLGVGGGNSRLGVPSYTCYGWNTASGHEFFLRAKAGGSRAGRPGRSGALRARPARCSCARPAVVVGLGYMVGGRGHFIADKSSSLRGLVRACSSSGNGAIKADAHPR